MARTFQMPALGALAALRLAPRSVPLRRSNLGLVRTIHPLRITVYYHQRHFSLRSLFAGKSFLGRINKTSSMPSPLTVADIASLEADANANQHDVGKQLTLFQALLDTGVQAGYDIIVSRWERACAFDHKSPLIASDAAFQFYLTALIKSGLSASVLPAARRRDAILNAPSSSSSSPPDSAKTSDSTTPTFTSDPLTASLNPERTQAPETISQRIAHIVLSATDPISKLPTSSILSPDISRLQAAFKRGGSGVGVHGNPLIVSVSEPRSAMVLKTLRFIVFAGLGFGLMVTILAVLLENSGLMKSGNKGEDFEYAGGQTVTFEDVHGIDEQKLEMQTIVEFLKNPSKFTSLGGRLPKGILLTGPPGTGKTLLARAIAGEAGVPFLYAAGSEFDDIWVGSGARRMRELFASAREKQPAVVFIDELDSIGGKRELVENRYSKQTLNQLLSEMDGFLTNDGLIVIATTNLPTLLDDALLRPGRFDKRVEVFLPDVRGRAKILERYLEGIKAAEDLDPNVIAKQTPYMSGADLQNLVNEAAIQASKEGASEVTYKHIDLAFDRITLGTELKSRLRNPKDLESTAYHEAGHTIVALNTEGAFPLRKVSCIHRGNHSGVTVSTPTEDESHTRRNLLARIDVCMGGMAAEEFSQGEDNVSTGASSDLQQATNVAHAMIEAYGFSDVLGPVQYRGRNTSPQTRDMIENEVRLMLKGSMERVKKLLKEKESELRLLAAALLEHETLDADEVRRAIKGQPIREEAVVAETDKSPADSEEDDS